VFGERADVGVLASLVGRVRCWSWWPAKAGL